MRFLPILLLLLAAFGCFSDASPMDTAKEFISKLKAAIDSHDRGIISGLLTDKFFYAKCSTEIKKDAVVSFLADIKQGTEYTITIKKVSEQRELIRIDVSITGLSFSPTMVFFIMEVDGSWKLGMAVSYCNNVLF